MAEKKPRILNDSRDMVWSLIPLLLICLVIAGVAGSCNWGFGSKAAEQPIPSFNSEAAFRADARTMPFPIREPALPEGWQSNSGTTRNIEGKLASNVGWIPPSSSYVQLTQSNAEEAALVRGILGDGVTGTGTREVGNRVWVAYENREGRKAWVTDLGDVRIAVLSPGGEDNMRVLAEATLKAEPLPRN